MKATIEIRDKDEDGEPLVFTGGRHEGEKYTLVEYEYKNNGGSSGCLTEQEIQETVEHFKRLMTIAGQVYELIDHRGQK